MLNHQLLIPLEHEMEMDTLYVCHVIRKIMNSAFGLPVGAITTAIHEKSIFQPWKLECIKIKNLYFDTFLNSENSIVHFFDTAKWFRLKKYHNCVYPRETPFKNRSSATSPVYFRQFSSQRDKNLKTKTTKEEYGYFSFVTFKRDFENETERYRTLVM